MRGLWDFLTSPAVTLVVAFVLTFLATLGLYELAHGVEKSALQIALIGAQAFLAGTCWERLSG